MNEDQILAKLTIEAQLARLRPELRTVLELSYGLRCPPDFPAELLTRWPPTYDAIGAYVGRKFRGKPMTEGMARYLEDCALWELGGESADTRWHPERCRKRKEAQNKGE